MNQRNTIALVDMLLLSLQLVFFLLQQILEVKLFIIVLYDALQKILSWLPCEFLLDNLILKLI